MVVLKRMLGNGHSGYHSLTIPRGPRSIRRKGFRRDKLHKGSEICSFDLLAAVAGNLMEEIEYSSSFATASCSVKVDSESVKIAGNVGRNSPKCGDSYDSDVGKRMNEKLDVDGGKYGDITVNNKSINTNGSFLKLGNGLKLGCKDDDEILCSYAQPYSKIKACKSTRKIDRKVNKLLTSKCRNAAPELRDYGNTNTDGAVKPTNNKRYRYDLNTSQRNTPLKKRKLCDRNSVVTYDGGLSNKDDKNALSLKLGEGNGMSNSAFGCHKSDSRNSQSSIVSIKSFEVPEFFIEVSESATVGLLKKTILETLTNILGGGLRVGVLVHGKKIRDDRTLLQTGISEGSIRIILEPDSPNQPSLPIRSQNPPISLPRDSPKTVNRSQINVNKDITGSDSKALVPVSEVNIGQRRIRRPFSVSEVEALVQAVEKLGTGRWRDVKLYAFENEKHRTYVDLKDKWKTLVHTARISPQQRRGEAVLQDLLDRVLAAQDRQPISNTVKKQQNTIIPKLSNSFFVRV